LKNATIQLEELPEQYYATDQKGLYFFQLGKIGDKGPGAGCDGPISKITRDLRIRGLGEEVVTLIDVKAGLEDFARGVITSMDWVITVVDPTVAAIQIAEDIDQLISRIKAGELPATHHLESPALKQQADRLYQQARIKGSFLVLNKIQDQEMENYVGEKLREKGLKALGTIYDDPSIARSWLKGVPFNSDKATAAVNFALEKMKQYIELQAAVKVLV
jgi:CO dehydrogenase nickel-insertion accessory protein CooC1